MGRRPTVRKNKNAIRESVGSRIFDVCNVVFFVLVALVMLVPLLKVLSDSFDAATSYGINLIPRNFTTEAYQTIIANTGMRNPFFVSVYTTILGTFLGLLVSCISAYVLLQKAMPGRKFIVGFIMFTMIFNGGLIPTYLVLRELNLLNTLWAIILPMALNVYNTILMKNFFEQIPPSLLESAEIDGCSPFRTFLRIVLPLSTPALASIGLFFAVGYWNEFFSYVMYITDTGLYNFQVKLRELVIENQNMSGGRVIVNLKTMQNAAIVVATVPFMIIYPFCQKYFVQGLTMGAVKE